MVPTDSELGRGAAPTAGAKIGQALLAVSCLAWTLVCFSLGIILLRWRATAGVAGPSTTVTPMHSRDAMRARGMVLLNLFGRVVAVPPGAGYLIVPLSSRHGPSPHTAVTWSGPMSAWPKFHRVTRHRWRIIVGAAGGLQFLTRVPLASGDMTVNVDGQPKPANYLVAERPGLGALEVSWFSRPRYSGEYRSVFLSDTARRKIDARCAKKLRRAGAAPWIAAIQSRRAVAELAKCPDQEVYLLGLEGHYGRIRKGSVTRLAARIAVQRWVWRPGGKTVYRSKLDTGDVYLYQSPYQWAQPHTPHLIVWRWLFFGRSGRCLAWGQMSCPATLAPIGVLRLVRASAGLGLEASGAAPDSGAHIDRSLGKDHWPEGGR